MKMVAVGGNYITLAPQMEYDIGAFLLRTDPFLSLRLLCHQKTVFMETNRKLIKYVLV